MSYLHADRLLSLRLCHNSRLDFHYRRLHNVARLNEINLGEVFAHIRIAPVVDLLLIRTFAERRNVPVIFVQAVQGLLAFNHLA